MSKALPINVTEKHIGLIDADLLDNGTNFPNLALMKISSYYKNLDNTVELINELYSNVNDDYDLLIISKVFDFTTIDEELLQKDNVFYGGTGFYFDKAEKLPEVIEHSKPDYDIYESYPDKLSSFYKDYSIGFTTRGCFRGCDFCVNQNCKKVTFHSHVTEWYEPNKKKICLLDDNILGYKNWKSVLEELIEINKPFQFKQGLDIRILTDEKAFYLSQCKYNGEFIFAFDDIKDKDIIENKLKLWRKYNSKATKFYVLTCFENQNEVEVINIFERIRILSKYGCLPYIMRHKNYKGSEVESIVTQIARWVNMPKFIKKCSFREFCELNQSYKKKKGLCSSMKALVEFENKYPEIAKEYFDIKFYE